MNEQHRQAFFQKLVASTNAYSMEDARAMNNEELTIVAQIVGSVREDEHESGKNGRMVLYASTSILFMLLTSYGLFLWQQFI